MNALEALLEKIRGRKALVGVIGLGYVGLPLALRFSEAGFRVLGFDTDAEKVRRLNAGTSYLLRFPDAAVRKARDSGFEASGARNRYAEPDALILCVPTPLNAHREPDLSFVPGSVEALAPQLRQGQIVSLESTPYPGTTEEELRPRIEARLEAGLALYGAAIDRVVPVSSTRAAEMTKLLENIHRAVNIGLVNEMKIVADRMGLDIHEIIRAAATKPFGFVPYLPGPGLGGHCIPVDPFYLTWKARQYGVNTRFIELAGEINHAMPGWVMEKLAAALNARRMSVNGSSVLVLGLAYKKNVEDLRESPSLRLIAMLKERGASVDYSDPFVPVFPRVRNYSFDMKSVALDPESVARYDALLLATDHDAFDYGMIARHARLIVDTRGRYLDPRDNVVKA